VGISEMVLCNGHLVYLAYRYRMHLRFGENSVPLQHANVVTVWFFFSASRGLRIRPFFVSHLKDSPDALRSKVPLQPVISPLLSIC